MFNRRPAGRDTGVSALAFNVALAELAAAVESPAPRRPARRLRRILTIATGVVAALLLVAAIAVTRTVR